jgi:hypothetical protein
MPDIYKRGLKEDIFQIETKDLSILKKYILKNIIFLFKSNMFPFRDNCQHNMKWFSF